tara:strand:- start:215 stop:457 length:243 start_codon:yes stop_codon:yes gene_type:complete
MTPHPIATAFLPGGPVETGTRVLLWSDPQWYCGAWDATATFASMPRPFWRFNQFSGVTFQRSHQPTHWMPLPEAPINAPA